MTTLQEAIEKGHKRYFKNSYWRGLYADAPDDAKKYYDLIFSQLDGGTEKENQGEFKARMNEVYKGLSAYGWEYIINNTTNRMAKHNLKEEKAKWSK